MHEEFRTSPFGYAYHEIVTGDGGKPVDYVFLEVNPAFERLTGLAAELITGKPVSEVIPSIRTDRFDWIGFYGAIALGGGNVTFEQYSDTLGRWYQVQAYSAKRGFFSTFFVDISDLKRASAELENFFSINPDLLCIADTDGHFLRVNSEWTNTLGYSTGELETRRFLELVHPDDIEETLAVMTDLARQKDVVDFVNRYRAKDGSYRFIEWRSHPEGKLIYAAARDITERRRTEEALAESRKTLESTVAFLNDTIEAIAQPFTVIEADTYRVSMANRAAGGAASVGKHCYSVFYGGQAPCERPDRPCPLDRVREQHAPAVAEHVVRTADGDQRWIEVHAYPIFGADGGVERILEHRIDITERKRNETIIQSFAAIQQIMFEMSSRFINIPIDTLDETIGAALRTVGEFVGADRAYIFEYDWDEGTCTNTYEWCAEGIAPVIETLQQVPITKVPVWVNAHRAGEPIRIPDVAAHDEEEIRTILESQDVRSLITLPMMEGEHCVGFIGFDSVRNRHSYSEQEITLLSIFSQMLINVQNRRRLESSLIDAKEIADAANRAKSEFLANMSHEIRTPMNAVIGLSTLALETARDSEQADLLGKIRASSKALLGIINDILDFSKIEAGKLELEIAEFGLEDVLDQMRTLFAAAAAKKGLELVFRVDPDLPRVFVGDSLRLGQILTNLIGNAVKFTEHGHVELSIVRACGADPACERLRFEVADTGIGIGKNELGRLFSAFTQVDASTTRKFGGTGLGLVISARLAKAMGGELDAESEQGTGSTFSFEIPLPAAVTESADIPSPSFEKELRVLIVDDQDIARAVVRRIFESWGAVCGEAADGKSAVDEVVRAARNGSPWQIIIIDWMMPGEIDGLGAITAIRALYRDGALSGPPVPILMLSAYEQRQIPEAEAAIDAFLNKPITPSLLHDAVLEALRESVHGSGPRIDAQPIRAPRSARRGRVVPAPVPDLSGFTILIAEDNELNREVVVRWLQKTGAKILTAPDGKQAAELVGTAGCDLVLMDIQMPVMDGYTAASLIRAEHPRLPIVALSAAVFDEDRQKSKDAGMNDHIGKPIDEHELYTVLSVWLTRDGSASMAGWSPAFIAGEQTSESGDWAAAGDTETLEGFDREAGLKSAGGDREFYEDLLRRFRADIAEKFGKIPELARSGDTAETKRLAHALKGVAGVVGAKDLARAAEAVETSYAGDGSFDPESVEKLDRGLESALAVLARIPDPASGNRSPEEPVSRKDGAAAVRELRQALRENLVIDDALLDRSTAFLEAVLHTGAANDLVRSIDAFDYDTASSVLAALEEKAGIES